MKTLDSNSVVNNNAKVASLDLQQMYDLVKEAEGSAWSGWFRPVWASIDEEDDNIILELGGAVSQGTTFRDSDNNFPINWVGSMECWNRTYGEDDAENWAEDCNEKPEDYDCEEVFEFEADNWAERKNEDEYDAFHYMMEDNSRKINLDAFDFDEDHSSIERTIVYNCAKYAKDKGYNFLYLD